MKFIAQYLHIEHKKLYYILAANGRYKRVPNNDMVMRENEHVLCMNLIIYASKLL